MSDETMDADDVEDALTELERAAIDDDQTSIRTRAWLRKCRDVLITHDAALRAQLADEQAHADRLASVLGHVMLHARLEGCPVCSSYPHIPMCALAKMADNHAARRAGGSNG